MGEVGEKLEGLESYLWVVSVDAGVAGGGPATGAVLRMAMVAACGGAPVSGRRQGGHGRVQQGQTKCGRLAARHRGACARLAGSNSMPAVAWLGNERGNSRNALERGKHEHQWLT